MNYGTVSNMTLTVAERVRVLRTGPVVHSWRRIAEIICDEFPLEADQDLRGNQLYGIDLCREAAKVLNVPDDEYQEKWL